MGYNNPVAAGLKLIREALQSPNYQAGVAGWTINKDGSAEFNNVVIRGGTVEGGTALFYSGTPAAGNLLVAISGTDGSDGLGNSWRNGLTVKGPGPTPTQDINSVNGNIYFGSTFFANYGANNPQITGIGGVSGGFTGLLLESGRDPGDPNSNSFNLRLIPGTVPGTETNSSAQMILRGGAAGSPKQDVLVTGGIYPCDNFALLIPASDFNLYANGWTQAGSVGDHNGMWAKLMATGHVSVDGVLLHSNGVGAVNNGMQIGGWPSQFAPTTTRWLAGFMDIDFSGSLQAMCMRVNTDATTYYFGPSVAAGHNVRVFLTSIYRLRDS